MATKVGFIGLGNMGKPIKDLRGADRTLLKGIHLILTGEMGKPEETAFTRK